MAARSKWQSALVTGGGSGIGLRLAERLLERGAKVGLFDLALRSEVRDRLGKLAERSGAACCFHEVDVRDASGVAAAVGEAVDALGTPDLAVNSAGVASSKAFDQLPAAEFERVVAVNLLGSRHFAAAVLPRMGPGGRLALIASLAGIVPNYGYTAYNASKFGVVGLAGALRLECRPRGVGVSVICPPEVETPMVADEHATGDRVALALKQFAGTLAVEPACDEILAGLDAGRFMIVPGRRARLTRRLAQIVPSLMNAVGDRMVDRALRQTSRARPL